MMQWSCNCMSPSRLPPGWWRALTRPGTRPPARLPGGGVVALEHAQEFAALDFFTLDAQLPRQRALPPPTVALGRVVVLAPADERGALAGGVLVIDRDGLGLAAAA